MRRKRFPQALGAAIVLVVFAACGGGGGAGSAPPVTNPGGPPPGSSSPGPGGSNNPGPTPTAGITPTPTLSPPPVPSPSSSPGTPSPAPSAFTWELGGGGTQGVVNGQPDMFTTGAHNENNDPHDGDYMPGDAGAQPQGGGQGPVGNTVDGISCDPTMSNNYHVHAFVGLFVNGTQIAIPDAVGIVNPRGEFTDSDGWINEEIYGDCFYHIHTHDSSGLVHVEDPDPSGMPISGTLFNLGNFFDIWGIQVTSNRFGTFQGPVTVYTSGQVSRANNCVNQYCEVGSNSYTQWTGDPHQIPLYSHEVIWFEVGSGNPDAPHLPGINFDIRQ